MHIFILIIALLTSGSSLADASIYQWTDNSGATHFSDNYQANAKKVALPKSAIYSVISAKNSATTTTSATTLSPAPVISAKNPDQYKKMLIKQPKNQETIQHDGGKANIILSLEPKLKNTDKIAVYLDGNKIMETTSISFEIKNIERGEHSLQTKIIDKNSSVLLESSVVIFYVHQTSEI